VARDFIVAIMKRQQYTSLSLIYYSTSRVVGRYPAVNSIHHSLFISMILSIPSHGCTANDGVQERDYSLKVVSHLSLY